MSMSVIPSRYLRVCYVVMLLCRYVVGVMLGCSAVRCSHGGSSFEVFGWAQVLWRGSGSSVSSRGSVWVLGGRS